MVNKNKSKGNSFERETCNLLGKYLGGNWERVPNSGAITGASNSFRKERLSAEQELLTRGDLIPPSEFEIAVECKAYKDFLFHGLLTDNKTLDKWLGQNEHDVETSNMESHRHCIIFKINRKGIYIVVPFDNDYLTEDINYTVYNRNNVKYLVFEFHQFFQSYKDIFKSKIERK
jgi:hypothetical protein